MSNRVYDRQTIQWTADDLVALEQAGQATYFPAAFTYVVKLPEGGSVAVRPEQILPADDEQPYHDDGCYEAEMAYERYLEDGGPHALAIQAEDDEERRREAMDPGLERRYDDDEMAAQVAAIRSRVADIRGHNDDDELINHFSI
jgi:hypothetical protein